MRTLKKSILSRSSHGVKGFEAQRRELIEKWLKEYNIQNYTINDDFTIDVNGDVNLFNMRLKEFPEYIQFGAVKGYFDCRFNQLTTLRGVPRIVKDSFDCSGNKLTSLEGAPKEIGRDFYCMYCNLISLKGALEKIRGSFDCSGNKLTSLKGAPKKVGELFDCSNNQLTTLEGAPKEVSWSFNCKNNYIKFTEDDVKVVCNVIGKGIFV